MKDKKIDIDGIKHIIESKNRVITIFNNSAFLRSKPYRHCELVDLCIDIARK